MPRTGSRSRRTRDSSQSLRPRGTTESPSRPTCRSSEHLGLSEQPCRSKHEHGQEHEVACELPPLRVDLTTDGLGYAEDDAADERAPQRPEAADDHGFEGEDQL